MGENTKIEWSDSTWNPIRARLPDGRWGYHCEHASEGCRRCYAESMNRRMLPAWGTGLAYNVPNREKVEIFLDSTELYRPISWRKSRRVFVCSMTDLFADFVTDEMRDQMFSVMQGCRSHTFQVLTKRADRMCAYFMRFKDNRNGWMTPGGMEADNCHVPIDKNRWPLPNVWLGVSCENQEWADKRIPWLLKTPAAVRFLSVEPLLGPVDLLSGPNTITQGNIHWCITGGESGHGARPAHPDWYRSLRDQCVAAGVAYFHKQNGEFVSVSEVAGAGAHHYFPDGATVRRVGKKAAGRLLDGRTWDEMPEVRR